MSAAWKIAHIVECASAADRVRARGLRRGQKRSDEINREYDPLAATCLALLIESRMLPDVSGSVGASGASEPKPEPNTPGEA